VLKASGRLATRRPLIVCLAWLALVFVGFGVGTGVFGRMSGTGTAVRGSESQRAGDLLGRLQPHGSDTIVAVVSGTRVTPLRPQVEQALTTLRHIPGVTAATDPFTTPRLISADTQALLIPVTVGDDIGDGDLDHAVAVLNGIRAPSVHVSGGPLLNSDLNHAAKHDVVNAELLSLPIVLILMIVVFGGLRAGLLPLAMTIGGVAGAFLLLYGFSFVTDVSTYAIQITTMLGLGLAVDYALLIVSRFRELRGETTDLAHAVRRTIETAGRTVAFSGLTVAVSLAGLMVFPNTFLRSIGASAVGVVLVDMLAALTLLPALLTLFGARIKPTGPARGAFFGRIAVAVAKRPVAVLLTLTAGLLVLAAPLTGLELSSGDARSLPTSTQARQAYDTVAAHFPAGTGSTTITVLIRPGADPALVTRFSHLPGVNSAQVTDLPGGTKDLELTPAGPTYGTAATHLVHTIRTDRAGQPVLVGGDAAHLADFQAMLTSRAPWAIGLGLVAIMVLLFAFTGSLLVPIRTILTTGLSLGAALGIVTWVFQSGHLAGLFGAEGQGALDMTIVPLVTAIAFGLAMDYEIFILGRMREAWQSTGDPHQAVVGGLRGTGRVVTSAALLIVVVFACFMTGSAAVILEVGLGLTLAVVIDATVVRMLLVPATMTLLGRAAWWAPAPLRRLHDRFGLTEAPATPAELPVATSGARP
jgi:putative drug exporter of the RND superfamily